MRETGSEHLTRIGGPFYGNGLSHLPLEVALQRRWPADRIAREPEISAGCWFDYRFCHPALRLHYFVNEYSKAWRRAHHVFFDRDENVEDYVPWMCQNIYRCSETVIRQAIDTMQFMDKLLIPYDVFFDAGNRFLLQTAGYTSVMRKNKGLRADKLPPIRMFRRADVAIAAQTRMDQITQTRMIYGQHPNFLATNWRGTAAQRDHAAWLIKEARRTGPGLQMRLAALAEQGLITAKIIQDLGTQGLLSQH